MTQSKLTETRHKWDLSMAFIDDDAVEELRGILAVIDDLFCRLRVGPALLEEGFFLGGFVDLFTLQDGIHALNGADADLDIVRNIRAVQAAHAVMLGKGAVPLRQCLCKGRRYGQHTGF